MNANWGTPGKVKTRSGDTLILMKAPVPEGFWDIWRIEANKKLLKANGIGPGKFNGVWELKLWYNPKAGDFETDEWGKKKYETAISEILESVNERLVDPEADES